MHFLRSSLGRKIIMALSGLGLYIFVVGHLLGNLSILIGPGAFNSYSHKLISLGPLLYAIEFGLVAVFLFHVIYAILVQRGNLQARNVRYKVINDAGKPSVKSISSRSMIYTGILLFIFLIIHVKTFKYGPSISDGYVFISGGEEVRDLYRLVIETFKNPVYVLGYFLSMVFLGLHLRHAFWSAFQSLGAMHPKYSPGIYATGVILAVLLAIGFIFLPVFVYFMK